MKKENFDPSKVNRVVLGIIERHGCTPEEAEKIYANLRLQLIVGNRIKQSTSLQSALVTAVNCGKRAFGGGVYVEMPERVECLIPWNKNSSLNEVVGELGGRFVKSSHSNFTLNFGVEANEENSAEVICNGWQAGILIPGDAIQLNPIPDFATGGIAAGSLGVAFAFLKSSEINVTCADFSSGMSLWKPHSHWLDDDSNGPTLTKLPSEFWILGLGHLGQAYLWNIGLLPYVHPGNIKILLQDFDTIEDGNMAAGLLSEPSQVGLKKTFVCNAWLTSRGFKTEINPTHFDHQTRVQKSQPLIALCGFDNALSRVPLLETGFRYIVESGLGNDATDFDKIVMHTFPDSSKSPFEIWGHLISGNNELNKKVMEAYKNKTDLCGVEMIGGKAIATSFVGAFSGALTISELLRGLHSGTRYEKATISMRNLKSKSFFSKGVYTTQLEN